MQKIDEEILLKRHLTRLFRGERRVAPERRIRALARAEVKLGGYRVGAPLTPGGQHCA